MLLPLIVGSEKKNKGDSPRCCFDRCFTCSLFDVKIQIPKNAGTRVKHNCVSKLNARFHDCSLFSQRGNTSPLWSRTL